MTALVRGCDVDPPADSIDARICTQECALCARRAETRLLGVCHNCAGASIG